VWWLAAGLGALVIIWSTAKSSWQDSSGAITPPIAEVQVILGGRSMTAACEVRDVMGRPMTGVMVHVMNDSGGGLEATDTNGVVVIELSEPEVTGVRLNGVLVYDRRQVPINFVENGLQFRITVANTNAIWP
jgi:hypothetical protein